MTTRQTRQRPVAKRPATTSTPAAVAVAGSQTRWEIAETKAGQSPKTFLADGWEPYAVTTSVGGRTVYHFRRQRPTKQP